jgi:hypothetical protein
MTATRRFPRLARALLFALAALAAQPALAEDARKFCASAGDDDQTRPIPAALTPDAIRLFGFPAQASGFVRRGSVYRCMDGAVWLCNYGANLSCAKGDASRSSQGAENFCRQNPDAAIVPMAATGHETIFTWKCVGTAPQIASAEKTDARGFIAGQWKRLGPN